MDLRFEIVFSTTCGRKKGVSPEDTGRCCLFMYLSMTMLLRKCVCFSVLFSLIVVLCCVVCGFIVLFYFSVLLFFVLCCSVLCCACFLFVLYIFLFRNVLFLYNVRYCELLHTHRLWTL